ncbi:UbiD family decarboxylase [Rhodococcus opacus]|jgi:2,5-furandicarboxylate decarboxylase 1|uniref:UbiD family decarboxylase n=1 Tax=Rhodococcus opacus TaxID=37919 RepID=UPI00247439CC|nr:UbiD family decarboxylase [Rhodococcus opacus]MDH6286318.1 2,5-furandicarboxylate decarboxylase 1 [Rhodococcus opacus]
MTSTPLPVGASLRGWLDHLQRSGRLTLTNPDVDLRFGVAGVANRLDGISASVFPAPGGHPVPIVSGLLSQRSWMAEAAGVEQSELITRFEDACLHPVPSEETSHAPCQQLVHHDVDLEKQLPIPTHNEHDHGAYITAGLLIARRPDTGVQNVSIHRLQVSGPNRLGALLLPRHTLAFFAEQEREGADLDIAIVVGVDPLTLMASQAIVPIDHDELEISGALRGAPLTVTKCVTNSVRVPAEAEFVLEGRLLSNVREPEGPFGEFPQYYGERAERHVIEIDALTQRESPVYHTIVGGGLEHLLLGGIPREASFLSHLKRSFPCVRDVHLSRGGTCRYHLYVQLETPKPGEAKNVILGAFATHYDIKHVTVVDIDVDVHDPTEVEWAVATRFQADRDLVVVAGSQGSKLDPSTADGFGTKMGLDATVPTDAPEMRFTRIRVPGQQQIHLDEVAAPAPGDWHERATRPR